MVFVVPLGTFFPLGTTPFEKRMIFRRCRTIRKILTTISISAKSNVINHAETGMCVRHSKRCLPATWPHRIVVVIIRLLSRLFTRCLGLLSICDVLDCVLLCFLTRYVCLIRFGLCMICSCCIWVLFSVMCWDVSRLIDVIDDCSMICYVFWAYYVMFNALFEWLLSCVLVA